MANVLKKIKAKEKRERSRLRQRLVMVAIAMLFFSAMFAGILYVYTTNASNARQEVAQQGVNALAMGDLTRARARLMQADADGEIYATEFLAWMETCAGNYNEALQYALKASNYDRYSVYEVLGNLALIGIGERGAVGPAAAISYFEQGALKMARQQIQAEQDIDDGDMFINDHGNLRDLPAVNERAVQLFSDMVRRALPVFSDEDEYCDFVFRARSKGAPKLEMVIGDMLFMGNNRVAANAGKSVELWQKAMDNGDERAYMRLAGSYWHGYVFERDPQTAIDLYSAAANKGDPVALYALGLISLRHPGTNDSVAVTLFNNASSMGYGPASTALGVLSITETQDQLSVQRAAQWFKIAAIDQNDLSGRIFYDLMLMSGSGMKRQFSEGFDDMLLLAKDFAPAQSILDVLQKRVNPDDVLREALILSNLVLRGQIAYREGDPMSPPDLEDPTTGELMARPISFYKSVTTLPDAVRERFGTFNFTAPSKLAELTINGKKILSPDLAKLIVQYAPSTGVSRFNQTPMMPRPQAPRIPPHYTISDFVPPVNLVEVLPLYNTTAGIKAYTKIQ